MLKSISVVLGSYMLSVVLVLATDPLLSRLFPGDFVKGHVPSDTALIASTMLFVVVSMLCRSFVPGSAPVLLRSTPRGMYSGSLSWGKRWASARLFRTGVRAGRTGTGSLGCSPGR